MLCIAVARVEPAGAGWGGGSRDSFPPCERRTRCAADGASRYGKFERVPRGPETPRPTPPAGSTGSRAMIHRECGVLKTTLRSRHGAVSAADRAVDGGGAGGAVLSRHPADAARVLPVGRQPRLDRRHRGARPQHPGRLHRAGLDRPRRVHVGRRLHGGQPRQPARLAVARESARRRPDGGADRRHRRHPVAAHQGALPGHRHAGRAAHHRVDDQPRDVHQRRRAGLDRGGAAAAGPDGARAASATCTTSCSCSSSSPSSAR